MTIPCIPNEIVAEIVLHLEDESVSESIKEGKTVSLVCRNWRPYGQALRWKRLGLVPNDCPRLLDHFSNHGGLAELVRECSIVGPMDDTPDSYSEFPELLSKFSNLQEFSLNGDLGHHYSPVIDILSRLPRLQDCNMYGFGRDKEEWLHEGAWLPRSGFKKLSCLNFSPPNPFFPIPPDSRNHLIPNQLDDEPPSENTFPVRSLILGFCSFIDVDRILANRNFPSPRSNNSPTRKSYRISSMLLLPSMARQMYEPQVPHRHDRHPPHPSTLSPNPPIPSSFPSTRFTRYLYDGPRRTNHLSGSDL